MVKGVRCFRVLYFWHSRGMFLVVRIRIWDWHCVGVYKARLDNQFSSERWFGNWNVKLDLYYFLVSLSSNYSTRIALD